MGTQEPDAAWTRKGGTLSDKSARKEFGLTQEEIIEAVRRGELQYRVNSVYGNPFLRLIRSQVEAFVERKHGSIHLKKKRIQKELGEIHRDLRVLKTKVLRLEKRRGELLASLERMDRSARPHHRTASESRTHRR